MKRLTTILMAAAMAAAGSARVAAQSEPYVVHETRPVILRGPLLAAPTETSVTVTWTTDTPCHSKVVYGTGETLDQEADNAEHGLLPIGLTHAVQITGLEPGRTYRYRVVSTRVVRMKAYWPEKGQAAESAVHTFTTFDRRKESVRFALMTDTHEDLARLGALTKLAEIGSLDFMAHLGDAFHGIESEEALETRFLEPMAKALGHEKPLLYARGNHEARGAGARALMEHLAIPEGRFYYARDHGPVHFVVLDTGEDKDDATNVYARLNRFRPYREEELRWFREHTKEGGRAAAAPFRVLLMHAPEWGWTDGRGAEWTSAANEAGIDLAVSGHTHRFAHTRPGERGRNYHQLVLAPDQVALVEASAAELRVTVKKQDGSVVEAFTVAKR